MNPTKVVIHIYGVLEHTLGSLLSSRIHWSANESPHVHPHGQILTFHVACRNLANIGFALHDHLLCPYALWRAVVPFSRWFRAVNQRYGIVNIYPQYALYSRQVHVVTVFSKLCPAL